MSPRATGGRVVSRGKIRVDARRAVAKLREHMLLDLHSYALEIVRSAVGSGALQIDITYDADDVVITWPGAPGEPDLLARLLDLVLSDALTGESRRWRLLALGVNAALGLKPAFVDVIASGIRSNSGCVRVRFAPEMLDQDDGPAQATTAQPIPRPGDMPASGMRVHVRRKLSWSTIKGAVMGNVPREVQVLVEAAKHLDTPLRLHGQPVAPGPAAALLRIPFEVSHARRAWLAITPPSASGGRLTFLEHGVRLASYGWSPEPDAPGQPYAGVGLPVEVVVDAAELPTNASRAAIREDAPIVARTLVAAASAFQAAIGALIARVCGQGAVPDGVEMMVDDPVALEDALGAIVCVAAGARHRNEPLGEMAKRLLDLPLLRDGCGLPRSYSSIVAGTRTPLYVHSGDQPLETDLAFWMRDVVWLRQRVAERALTGLRLADAAPVVEHARVAAERRRRFFEHTPGAVRLPSSNAHLCREAFEVTEGRFAGLYGEVALIAPGVGARGVTVRVFLDGRQLCTEQVAPDVVPLGVEAALAWDKRLQVSFGFDGIHQNQAFGSAIWYAVQLAVMQARSLAEQLAGLTEEVKGRTRPVLRAAVGAALEAGKGLKLEGVLPGSIREGDPLWTARCWRTTEPGRYESLATLASYARAKGGICVAGPQIEGIAADARPIVAADRAEQSWLMGALGPSVVMVPYDRGALNPRRAKRRAAARSGELRSALAAARPGAETELVAPFLPFPLPGGRGLIGIAAETSRVRLHLGVPLSKQPAPRSYGSVAFVVDDDRILPTEEWDDVLWSPPPHSLDGAERQLLGTVIAALEGDRTAFERLGDAPRSPSEAGPLLTSYLLESAQSLRRRIEQLESLASLGKAFGGEQEADSEGGDPSADEAHSDGPSGPSPPNKHEQLHAAFVDLEDRLTALPVLQVLDEQGRARQASLAEVAAARTDPIPIVDRVLGFETLSWRPVLATDERLVRCLRRWSPSGAKSATPHDISVRRELADRHRASRSLLDKPRLDFSDLRTLLRDYKNLSPTSQVHSTAPTTATGDGTEVATSFDATELQPADGAACAAVVLVPGGQPTRITVEVLFRRRALTRMFLEQPALPIVARVNLLDEANLVSWEGLDLAGLEQVKRLITVAAFGLAESILQAAQKDDPARLFNNSSALALVSGLLELGDREHRNAKKRLAAMLRDKSLRWPTIQGKSTSWTALFRAKGVIYGGADRYSPWHHGKRGKSELDRHVLWMPLGAEGDRLRRMIEALGKTARDVTKAVANLQARRAKTATVQAPQLSGEPLTPLLRASLSSLGVRSCEGELEICLGPDSEALLSDLEGPPRRLPGDSLPIPIRAVARIDSVATQRSTKRVLRDIGHAAVRHLRELSEHLDELPPFARDHYRRFICSKLPAHLTERTDLQQRDRQAQVFGDVVGRWWSLDELQAAVEDDTVKQWWFTFSPPPYPSHDYGRPILRLCEADDLARLRVALPLRNMTKTLARDLAGEDRARAAQRESFVLAPEIRSRCLLAFTLHGGSLEGEIGILARDAHSLRGLRIHAGRRPLCTLEDGDGLPLCAVLNDDTLRPNRSFDGFASHKDKQLLVAGVREAAQIRLEQWLPSPGYAIASRWVDTSQSKAERDGEQGSGSEAAEHDDSRPLVVGRLWLPGLWPADPTVRIRTASRPEGEPLALRVLDGPSQLDGRLPIGGELLVLVRSSDGGDVQAELVKLASDALLEMLDDVESAECEAQPRELARYRWDCWLLLDPAGEPPTIEVRGGGTVGPTEIRDELSSRGQLWYSADRGSSMGHFPEGEPSFILRAESPLTSLLRYRALPGVLRELGGLPAARADGAVPEDEQPLMPPLAGQGDPGPVGATIDVFGLQHPLGEHDDDTAETGWLGGLVRQVTGVFSGEAPTDQELANISPELADALRNALERLALTGEPVRAVEYTRSGRPVRYDDDRHCVLINPNHRVVRALATKPLAADRLALLVAAAVSEINRSLESVTDTEEHRALLDLLSAHSG